MQLAPWPFYDDEQIEAVAAVLRSGRVNYWTGTLGRQFEQTFARYVGTAHAVATANGTLALELALWSLGVGGGDEVIVPARTFVGTASAVVARGATPVFADVDPISGNLSAQTVAPLISARTRAIIAVHLGGWLVDMPPLMELARQRHLLVIEDCAQAHGATLDGCKAGSFGDAATFSFCQDKIISTGGEGGMLLCNRPDYFEQAWSYKDHGKRRAAADAPPVTGYRWVHDGPGSNFRMNEIQAVLGLLQLQQLDDWLEIRRTHAARLKRILQRIIELPVPLVGARPAFYRFGFTLPDALVPWRDEIAGRLVAEGVPISTGVCPLLFREKALHRFAPQHQCRGAESLAQSGLYLPVHPTLDEEQVEWMGATVARTIKLYM